MPGNRKPLTEKEARAALSERAADEVLRRLEQEAVLRAEEHQGSRYFELGHDWLAKRVYEQKQGRALEEARRSGDRSYFEKRKPGTKLLRLVKQIENLGLKVQMDPEAMGKLRIAA